MSNVVMLPPPEPEPAALPWDPVTGEAADPERRYLRWASAYLGDDALRRGDETVPPSGPRRTWTAAERARWPEPTPPPKPKRPKPKVGRIDVPDRYRKRDAPPQLERPAGTAPMVTPTRGEALARRLRTSGVTSARWEQTAPGRWGLYVDEGQERAAQRILSREASL